MNARADRIYEQVLVLRCQAGDGAAFEELVALYGPRLRYYVRKMLGHAEVTEDVLQEVWLDVYRAMPRLAHVAAFPAWIYRIARDHTNNQLRKQHRAPQPLAEEQDVADPTQDGRGEEFTAEDAQRVHAALDKLPPAQREVLVLRFLEEMTYEDIGRVVGCPPGTVRSRIHYAKRALRRLLEGTYDHD
jgi:RNA polymerase sigma-70 factor (ECF subfamily)